MTYDSLERSRDAGSPVELYRFAVGGLLWRYVQGDQPWTYQGHQYLPEPGIGREALEYGRDGAVDGPVIRLPRTNPVAQLFVAGMPTEPVMVTVFRFHRDAPDDVMALPPATVGSWDYDDATGTVRLSCAAVPQLLEREIPTLCVTRHCAPTWALYGPGCRVNRAAYSDPCTVAAVDGLEVQLTMTTPRVDGWYACGSLDTPTGRRLMVVAHVGDVLTPLTPPSPDLVAGAEVVAVAGCDRSIATCQAKFGNAARFMGWPGLAESNPFTVGV